jgi:hypothetical protein
MWSNPDEQWSGFQPVHYWLDRQKVLSVPFTRAERSGDKWVEAGDMTLGSILVEGANRSVRTMPPVNLRGTATTEHVNELVVASVSFNCELLETLLSFRARDIEAFNSMWFWYSSATCLKTPLDSHSFFVVNKEKIVSERVRFADAYGNGFDPAILCSDETEEFWSDEKGWSDAVLRFWYRMFYRETLTGQLMVLRSDEPDLFHYPEGELSRRIYAGSQDTNVLTKLQAAFATLDGMDRKV